MNPYIRLMRERARQARPYVDNAPLSVALLPRNLQWYFCRKCNEQKPRSEFEREQNPKKLEHWCKSCRLKYAQHVPDCVAKQCIRQQLQIPRDAIPSDLIELKRKQIQLRRLRKEHENHERHRGTVLARD